MATVLDHIETDRKLITAIFAKYEADVEAVGGTLEKITDLVAGAVGDIDGNLIQAAAVNGRPSASRLDLASFLDTTVRALSEINLRQTAVTLDRNDLPPTSALTDILGIGIREWMLANAATYKSRGVTHTAPAVVGVPVGNGVLLAHFHDDTGAASPIANGLTLEAVTDEKLTFVCVADAIAGGRDAGNELFDVIGEQSARDLLEIGGSESSTQIEAINATTATEHISNGDFETAISGTTATKIPSWTIVGTVGNVVQAPGAVFRGSFAIAFVGNATIEQVAINLPAQGPVLCHVVLNRNGTGVTGTGTLELGGALKTIDLSTLPASGATRFSFFAWPKQFATGTSVKARFGVSGGASFGTGLVVDEFIVAQVGRIGGRYHALLAGSIDFRRGDKWEQDTAVLDTGKNKAVLHRVHGFGFELPHSALPTILDPP